MNVTAGWCARRWRFERDGRLDAGFEVFVFLAQHEQVDGPLLVHHLAADTPQVGVLEPEIAAQVGIELFERRISLVEDDPVPQLYESRFEHGAAFQAR
ncbi:MAG: hypothetical protein RIB57_06985 [Pelagibacterium sp.]